jgi:glycosyltransferase involved in cell wall biosynthesis
MSDNKEYVLVTEYYHPDTATTGQLMTDLAEGLKDRGLKMTVYTGQPNYHSGENKKQPRISKHNGVPVKRIRAPQVRQTSLLRRLVNWTIFTVWMFFVMLLSRTDKERDVVFVSNPPFLPVAMWIACRIRGWNYTYIVHDLYPDQPVELNYIKQGGIIHRVWGFLDKLALLAAENVVALGSVMKERINQKAGPKFNPSKVKIIHNWEDEECIQPRDKENNWFSKEHDLVEPFTVLYSGNIADFHDLETVVEAAAEFEDKNVQFLIIGEGDNKETIVSRAEELGLRGETVRFLPYQPVENLPYSLTSADVSIVTVKEGFEGVCVSSKLYTAMAAGEPVLTIAQPDDDESRIISKFDAGIHISQGDVAGVVEAIERWRQNPELLEQQGENARRAFEENFTTDASIDEYYDLLQSN